MKTRNSRTFPTLFLSSLVASLALCASFLPASQPPTIEELIATQLSHKIPTAFSADTDAAPAAGTVTTQDFIDSIHATTAPAATNADDWQNTAATTAASNDPRALAAAPPASPMVAPYGLALDEFGNLYVADSKANAIWKITNDTKIALLAGDPNHKSGSTNGKGTAARFNYPVNLALRAGTLYVTEFANNTIRAIAPDGAVRTFAGSAKATGTTYREGTGDKAIFNKPAGITFDNTGQLFVADGGNRYIRKITTSGATSWLSGATLPSGGLYSGGAVTLCSSAALTKYGGGVLLFDSGSLDGAVSSTLYIGGAASNQLNLTNYSGGALFTTGATSIKLTSLSLLGNALTSDNLVLDVSDILASGTHTGSGWCNVDGTSTEGIVYSYSGSSFFSTGSNVYSLSGSNTVLFNAFTGTLTLSDTTIFNTSGTSQPPPAEAPCFFESPVAADTTPLSPIFADIEPLAPNACLFSSLWGLTLSPDGNYVYASADVFDIYAIKISDGSVIPLDAALFGDYDNPMRPIWTANLRFDSQGNLYLADYGNNRILKVDAFDGTVTCLAGGGTLDADGFGESGYKDGHGSVALFNAPTDIAIDNAGNLYVADSGNGVIRKIDAATNNVTTLVLDEVPLASINNNGIGSAAPGDGGGGALSPWCLLALAALGVARLRRR